MCARFLTRDALSANAREICDFKTDFRRAVSSRVFARLPLHFQTKLSRSTPPYSIRDISDLLRASWVL